VIVDSLQFCGGCFRGGQVPAVLCFALIVYSMECV
jgi:hypothetical protein